MRPGSAHKLRPPRLIALLERQGCEVTRCKDGHKVRIPSGQVFVTHSLVHYNKADGHATENFVIMLRKAGVELPG